MEEVGRGLGKRRGGARKNNVVRNTSGNDIVHAVLLADGAAVENIIIDDVVIA